VRAHFDSNILLDGLSREESQLVLSTLPQGCQRIYLNPLDKGLSGSKVFAGRYEVNGGPNRSKPFVFKIGDLKKINQEYEAIENFVRPHISGIGNPVYRRGITRGLTVQELAGLSARSSLDSLKEHVRTFARADETIQRLFEGRLNGWYQTERTCLHSHKIEDLFKWYLTKVTSNDPIPEGWGDLNLWVKEQTGLSCAELPKVVDYLKSQSITNPVLK